MAARAVVRDVGRVLDMTYAEVDAVVQDDSLRAGHDAGQGALEMSSELRGGV